MLKRTGQEGKLLAPTAPRLLAPDQRVERMQLAFVIAGFALDAQRLERAVQASGVIPQISVILGPCAGGAKPADEQQLRLGDVCRGLGDLQH